jgi:hypothetical protein
MSKGKYFFAIPGLISIRCRLAVLRVDMKVGCKEGNCNRLNYLLRRSRRRIWVVNQWKILILVDGGLYKVIVGVLCIFVVAEVITGVCLVIV